MSLVRMALRDIGGTGGTDHPVTANLQSVVGSADSFVRANRLLGNEPEHENKDQLSSRGDFRGCVDRRPRPADHHPAAHQSSRPKNSSHMEPCGPTSPARPVRTCSYSVAKR